MFHVKQKQEKSMEPERKRLIKKLLAPDAITTKRTIGVKWHDRATRHGEFIEQIQVNQEK